MLNRDFTYCLGKDCSMRDTCYRYVEGKKIPSSSDEGWWWCESCSTEYRDGYIKTKKEE